MQWVKIFKTSFYYSDHYTTHINDSETYDVSIFPNPTSESITIRFSNNQNTALFELYNMYGSNIITKKVTNSEQLRLSHLNNGMYFYNLNIDGNIKNGKLTLH